MDWREDAIRKELSQISGFSAEDVSVLDTYDDLTAEKVLSVLLEWACYSQNDTSIMMGRKMISEISKDWLVCHLPAVVGNCFEYTDEWNYRRLLELTAEYAPEAMEKILALNNGTNNAELLEVIDEFRTGRRG